MTTNKRGLLERLNSGEEVIVAEGYLFEFERRCYLKAGAYVPEVVLEHPDLVEAMHEEMVHAGSDVVLAFTYYGHREKLRYVGREGELEKLNRLALRIAKKVADRHDKLMAGNISNTTVFDPSNPASFEETTSIFKEQIQWAVEEGADYIVGETFSFYAEAKLAVDAVKKYGKGLPSVITMMIHNEDVTYENMPLAEAMRKLEEDGASVVGLNCSRGPQSMALGLKVVREACKGHIAGLPVCYRTDPKDNNMCFQALIDVEHGGMAFPYDLDAWFVSRTQIEQYARACREIGVKYIGLCCGNCAHYVRTLAMTLGRTPPAARYSPDMSQHFMWGDHPRNREVYKDLRGFLNPAMKEQPKA